VVRRTLGASVILLIAAVVQTTIGHALAVRGVPADLVLVLVVCRGLIAGSGDGVWWGFIGGLILDLLSGAPAGAQALGLTVCGYLAGAGQRSPLQHRFLAPLGLVVISTVFFRLALALTLRVAGQPVAVGWGLLHVLVMSLLGNLVLTPIVYGLMLLFADRRGSLQSDF
jgi:rod shape-determining protein MreD